MLMAALLGLNELVVQVVTRETQSLHSVMAAASLLVNSEVLQTLVAPHSQVLEA